MARTARRFAQDRAMPSDRTRTSDDLAQQYQAVVLQQGRVLLDRDFNALQEIVTGQSAADALDEVGPCGTPDNGFAVSLPDGGASFSASAADFVVAPGTMYVGGRRVYLPAAGGPWGYFHQPDWPAPDPLPAAFSASHSGPLREFVYLHVFEQEVGAVEDPDLLDVALGGPDTTQRVRLMRRVKRAPATVTAPTAALNEASAAWRRAGFALDAGSMSLAPQASLQVSFPAPASGPPSPCDTAAPGGFLGAENQLIRVQICDPTPGGTARLLWGYDNASFLYRVTPQPDGSTLQLGRPPVDAFHCPRQGQVVEVLRTAAVLGTVPDETDPARQATVTRCVAEATGLVTTVQSYDPGGHKVVLTAPLPPAYLNDPNPLFLRVWQGLQTFDPAAPQPVPLADPTGKPAPGLQVTITVPRVIVPVAAPPASGPRGRPEPIPLPARVALQFGVPPVGAFWQIAVRPGTPQAVYPERFLTAPQPPDGPKQWAAPLAVIDWGGPASASVPAHSAPVSLAPRPGTSVSVPVRPAAAAPFSVPHPAPAGPVVHDCRLQFDNLVTLSNRRRGGCCTLTVLPTDAGQLQDLIDNAVAPGGGPVAVCFSPGTYNLPEPLLLTSMHAGLVLESCPGGVVLQADSGADPALFLDGLAVLIQADGVTLRGLRLSLPAVPVPAALATTLAGQASLQSLLGVRLLQSRRVKVEGCQFDFTPAAGTAAFGAGLFARGDCGGLTVTGCRFQSASPATSTPVPTGAAPAAPATPPLALFGALALPASAQVGEQVVTLPPALDGAALAENDFVNLTLALLANADLGEVRLRGNRVRACLGGLWLEALDDVEPVTPPNPAGLSWQACYAALLAFTEIKNGFSCGQLFPWPAALDPTSLSVLLKAPRAAAGASLGITGNRLDTQLPDPPGRGGPGLVLSLSRPPGAAAALVLAANELRGGTASLKVPLALLAVAGRAAEGPAALTGNLVVNTATAASPAEFPSSLLLFPAGGTQSVVGLTVTGNVLVGSTNLGDLNLPPPLTTWVPLNSLFPPPQQPPPVVTAISPTTGTTGTKVSITGSSFTGATQVTFGTVPAVSFAVNSDRSITAVAPPAPPPGPTPPDVVVWTASGSSAPTPADQFTYTAAQPPLVTGVGPNTGSAAGGFPVTILGTGFTGATAVRFGNVPVAPGNFRVAGDTVIQVLSAPASPPGQVDIFVSVGAVTSGSTATDRFLYLGAPVITGVSPSVGLSRGGTEVTITGSGFVPGGTTVRFGAAASPSVTVNSGTSLTATSPPGSAGTVTLTVTTATGSATASFTYFTPRPPPPPPPPHPLPDFPGPKKLPPRIILEE
jgi:hypothetical protein